MPFEFQFINIWICMQVLKHYKLKQEKIPTKKKKKEKENVKQVKCSGWVTLITLKWNRYYFLKTPFLKDISPQKYVWILLWINQCRLHFILAAEQVNLLFRYHIWTKKIYQVSGMCVEAFSYRITKQVSVMKGNLWFPERCFYLIAKIP